MQIGLVGLGRMGANMSRRWLAAGHSVVGYARHAETVNGLLAGKAISAGATSLKDLVGQLSTPRVIWLMVPAASVDATLDELVPLLARDDVVVDGGNSYYVDDLRRSATLAEAGIHYLDCGTSGGVAGRERGYCLMIGGPAEAVRRLDPIFRTLAPGADAAPRTPGRTGDPTPAENGYLHCGPSGAGHFVKMVHNGIEYGLMAAYAEGLNILEHADAGRAQREVSAEITPLRDPALYQYELDIPAAATRSSASSMPCSPAAAPSTTSASPTSTAVTPTTSGGDSHDASRRWVTSSPSSHAPRDGRIFEAGCERTSQRKLPPDSRPSPSGMSR